MQNTIPKHLSVTKENNRLNHSRRFPMAASLFPHSVFSRSNTIARTNSCTTQDTSPLLQRMSDFARNVRTVFSWDPRDHIAGTAISTSKMGKHFSSHHNFLKVTRADFANCGCFQKSSAQAKFVVPIMPHKTLS